MLVIKNINEPKPNPNPNPNPTDSCLSGTPQSLVLISSPPTLVSSTTTTMMIMLISYKPVFYIIPLRFQGSVRFFAVTARLIRFLSIQFPLFLIYTCPTWSVRAMV